MSFIRKGKAQKRQKVFLYIIVGLVITSFLLSIMAVSIL